jgi:hypothetical protein
MDEKTNLFLLHLPTELVQRILEHLDISALATCSQVSVPSLILLLTE